MDFSGLDTFLRTKERARPKWSKKPTQRADRTKAPYTSLPEVLKEVLEEQSRQFKAYKAAKDWEIEQYRDEYPAFNKFYRIIKREEKTACLIYPGQLDLDLADAIVRLKLHRLPSRVRRMCLSLVATLERKVTQRETGFPFNDALPTSWSSTASSSSLSIPSSRPTTSSRMDGFRKGGSTLPKSTTAPASSPTSSGTLTECRLALLLT